jgi:predicted phage terminase large subunit-like protein
MEDGCISRLMEDTKNIPVMEERYILGGSLLEFTKTFYYLRTGRRFRLSDPIGRQSHFESIAQSLSDVVDGKISRLIINVPPRYGKTEMLIHFLAWAHAIYPDSNSLYVSYNLDLAMKQTGTIKHLMTMRQYQSLFNIYLSDDVRSKANFETTRGGSVYAAGAGGTITGRGAGVRGVLNRFSGAIIIDDIHKPDEVLSDSIRNGVIEWYYNTMVSRVNNAQTPIIFIGQRVHENDLAGHLIESGGWHVLSLPALDVHNHALHPELHTVEMLKEIERKNPYVFSAQYQQNPQPAGGGIFKPEWFYIMDEEPEILATFITADTAETSKTYNDASVFSFWGLYKVPNTEEYALHWIDCEELRVEPKDLEQAFIDFYNKCCRHKVKPRMAAIEKKSTGVTLISTLDKLRGLQIKSIDRNSTSGSKTQRFLEMQPYIAGKLVSFSKDARHSESVIEHMRKITANNSHRFDDICDTCQIAIEVGLIDKFARHSINRQNDRQDSQTAMKIMANLAKVIDIRKYRND